MAHIKDLHLNILRKVLKYFCSEIVSYPQSIQDFKQLLPPAAACRVWRECMLRYVYYTAYLEHHVIEADEGSETAQPEHEWKSNIDLIASQQLSSAIRELRVWSFGGSVDLVGMIHALESFGFSSSHWRSVNSLFIYTGYKDIVVHGSDIGSIDSEALATQLTEYFGRHVPNIGDLKLYLDPQSTVARSLSNMLVNLYFAQLHTLGCHPVPITFSRHSFSSKLRHLTVGIAPGISNRLPQLLASPVERLDLFDIPHNFAWWTFVGIAPSHIEFTNLRALALKFRQTAENADASADSDRQVDISTISLDTGHRKLSFPHLKELSIQNSPYSDGSLYSRFIHSPLQSVIISGSLSSVQHVDPRILLSVAEIQFLVDNVAPDNYNDFTQFCSKLLGSVSNAKTALLGVNQSNALLPIPTAIEWTNLENLTLSGSIHLPSVIQVVTQLPKLHTLKVENIVDELDEAGANLRAILRENHTKAPSVSASLRSLWIYSDHRLPLVFSLDVMRYLTVIIHSLDSVAVPDLYVSDMEEFINRHADNFPYLHKIMVHNLILIADPRGYYDQGIPFAAAFSLSRERRRELPTQQERGRLHG